MSEVVEKDIDSLNIGAPADEEEYEETEDPNIEQLKAASDLLKKSAILFEYLSERDFIKTISDRERKAMDRQIAKIYTFTEQLKEQLDLEEGF
jgi:hypothetical protein